MNMVFDFKPEKEIVMRPPPYEEAVLLPTVRVNVYAGKRSATIRGIIAWASHFNLISERCRKRFNLPLMGGGMPSIYAVGGTASELVGKSRIKFSPHFDEEHSLVLDVFVTNRINSTVEAARLHPMVRGNLSEFELADPLFDEPGDIDILMGETLCPLLLKDGRYTIPGTSCSVVESMLGWIVVGRAPLEQECDYEAQEAINYIYRS